MSAVQPALVQIGHDLGAAVIATSGAIATAQALLELGAHHVFDTDTEPLAQWCEN
ncbi:hypothetical protein [Streptomyces tauricus]|uniref:hypothetical protein n=1 Tax=Streptomyces tauricus TaxID=68274 RepID=UPI0033BF7930